MTEDAYMKESRRPLSSLLFILPMLAVYEMFKVVQAGSDDWMDLILQAFGIHCSFAPPLLVVASLLIWQHLSKEPWVTSPISLVGMWGESFAYAFGFVLLGAGLSIFLSLKTGWVWIYFGAGIYEEFFFRLLLLPLGYVILRVVMPKQAAMGVSIVVMGVAFSLMHYVNLDLDGPLMLFPGAAFRVMTVKHLWFGFVFRAIAGMLFGLIMVKRGFGVAVGSHAIYDILIASMGP